MMPKSSFNLLIFAAVAGLLAAAASLMAPLDQPEVKERFLRKPAPRSRISNRSHAERGELSRLLRLAGTDPRQAAREASALTDSPQRTQLLLEIAAEQVREDSRDALRLAETLTPSPARDDVLERAIREWAITDPVGAVAHAKSTSDAPLRERLLAAALVEWSNVNPFDAAGVAATELREGRIQDNAIVSISQRWAQSAPAEAAAWIESFPEGNLRSDARSSLGGPK